MKSLIRWEPLRELVDMGSLFDRFFGRDLMLERPIWGDRAWSPAIDLYDQKDRLVVKAELPGIEKKDVKVSVDGDILSIKGEVNQEQETKDKDYYYSERTYGSFYRTVALPVAVQKDKVKASYRDGILTIDLPKGEEAKPKEIEIQVQ